MSVKPIPGKSEKQGNGEKNENWNVRTHRPRDSG